ncbi:MAG: pimeloyl-ACP methyl ester carboxylesterase [Flavobacteriaceae bacterium]|jgi:pimeloyl-ACP methyl ester carboxylesterase
MKTLITILLCLPIIGFGQVNTTQTKLLEDSTRASQVKLKSLAPKMALKSSNKYNIENENKSGIMNFSYPIIFIHGLEGDGGSWYPFGNHINSNANFSWGGELEFCLNSYDITYIEDYCSIILDVQSFIPSNLPAADYYRIEFDCQTNGVCNTSNSAYINSNQSAIIKQGYALGIAIDKVLDSTGKDKVILMGHSMGGLAAREYIENSSHWKTNTHRVAKLITSGTPHGGSNSTSLGLGIGGIDEKSEAVRDLRKSYATSGYPGAYLYGGVYETDNYIQNNFFIPYHNVDVNCNGQEGDYVPGLNSAATIPGNLDYTCIISDWDGDSDFVVDTIDANLKNFYNIAKLETFWTNYYAHTTNSTLGMIGLLEADYINFKALDEPEYFWLAYKVALGDTYTGYSTYQDPNHPISYDTDIDSYYFIVNQTSNINIVVNDLNTNAKVELFDDPNYNLLAVSNANASGNASIQGTLAPGKYYIDITADAYGSSPWDYPYNFIINSSILSWDCISPGNCQNPGTGQGQYTTQSACQSACVSTSITEIDLVSISIYPNPTDGIFTIEFTTKTAIDVSFSVLNVLGQEIALNKIKAIVGVNKQQFDLSGFAKGVYTLKLISENGVMDKKVVLE